MSDIDLDLSANVITFSRSKGQIDTSMVSNSDLRIDYSSPVIHSNDKQNSSITESIPDNVISIIEAKHEWESSVDSLSQLAIILLDKELNIVRANKTIEKWNWGKINSVSGIHIAELIEPVISKSKHDEFYRLWLNLSDKSPTEWESRCILEGNSYRFTFYPIDDTSVNNCFMVLVIDDITERIKSESRLKSYVSELEFRQISYNRKLLYAKKRLEEKLKSEKEAKNQLQLLSKKLINAQETERKNVSSELHDGIGQILSAMKYQIEGALLSNKTLDATTVKDNLDYTLREILNNLKAAFIEVRRVSMNLRPSMLDELGVVTTLEWFSRDFNKVYNNLVIDKQISLEESDIPEKAKIVIFRIVQESFNNIAKYAHASQIRLQLFKKDSHICLRVIDDGHGFDIETTEQQHKFGLGLKSMKERAESINGKLKIRSSENSGTCIELIFSI